MKIILILLVTLPTSVFAQKEIEKFLNDKTKIENPLNLRDPFRAPVIKSVKERKGDQVTQDPEEVLQNVAINDIRVQGVLIGKERRAIIKISTNEKQVPVIIKEGYRIGPDRVEVKAILPGGIILVEKMINVYGQEEYLETVIPISQ